MTAINIILLYHKKERCYAFSFSYKMSDLFVSDFYVNKMTK